ncbi:MAG: hypothetical protein K2X99_04390 [Gemmatimonadaceae bacterium]|nr:hypothetical protein [Gemmatimonadaceae bacterium]
MTQGGGDSVQHYLIARYAPHHPDLFLDQWGKPLYTLLVAPVAHLGFLAVTLMNAGLLLATCFIAWRIALLQGLREAWLAPLLIGFSPVVLGNSNSGLTEPLAAAWLAFGLWLIARGDLRAGVLELSFLPFVRSEGFVVLLVVVVWLLAARQWMLVLLSSVGSLLFNLIGWWHTGATFWILSNNPYVNASPQFYGRGEPFDFVKSARTALGVMVLPVLFEAVASGRTWWRRWSGRESARTPAGEPEAVAFRWLLVGIAAAYVFAHALLWWRGWMGSYGLVRVVVVVAPLVAVLSVGVLSQWSIGARVRWLLVGVVPLLGLRAAQPLPLPMNEEVRLVRAAADVARRGIQVGQRLYAADPLVPLVLNRDPFDESQMAPLRSWREARVGDWLLWDAHFGGYDHGVPLEALEGEPRLRLVQSLAPPTSITTLKHRPYSVRLYQRRE